MAFGISWTVAFREDGTETKYWWHGYAEGFRSVQAGCRKFVSWAQARAETFGIVQGHPEVKMYEIERVQEAE